MDKPLDIKQISPKHKERLKILKRLLVWVARFVVGITFIFSGFAKAVDPWGTVYKMQEYFDVLQLNSLESFIVPISFFLFSLEFACGVFILTGCYRRISSWVATAFMAVFLPLTYWIMIKNPVSDCGCFGDAFPISNEATFWKNVILSVLILILLFFNRKVVCLITPAIQWVAFSITALFIVIIGWIGYFYQPLLDFRPYPIGKELVAENSESDEEVPELFGIYEKAGQRIKIPLDSIPDDSWTFVGREATDNKPSENAKPTGLSIYDASDDSDVTSDVIASKGDEIILFITSLKDISPATFYRLNSLYNYCEKHDIEMTAVAAANEQEIENFRDLSMAEYPIYLSEDTSIKEVVRGSPALVMLRNGKIMWKSSLAAIAPDDFMSSAAPKDAAEFARNNNVILNWLIFFYLSSMAVLIFLSFLPIIFKGAKRHRHNRFIKESTVLPVLMLLMLASCSDKDEPVPPGGKYDSATLVYMVANNTLSYDSNNDIGEILLACESINLSSNKVLVYIASPYYETGLYEVVKSKSGATSLKMIKAYDDAYFSVDKERIREVIDYSAAVAPADKRGLILWSHANGWLPYQNSSTANAPQKSFGDDYGHKINIDDLADAIPDNMMDYIWFDCCLMSNIEVIYALRDKADYIIASPTELMQEGMPYNLTLPYLARTEPDIVGAAETEYEYYLKWAKESLGFTIAVVDCSMLDELAMAAREIVYPKIPYISTTSIQTYGAQTVYLAGNVRVRISFYDLRQVFDNYALERNKNASALNNIIDKTVIYKAATPRFGSITINPDHFSGISTYIPISPDAAGYNSSIEEYYNNLAWVKAITAQ